MKIKKSRIIAGTIAAGLISISVFYFNGTTIDGGVDLGTSVGSDLNTSDISNDIDTSIDPEIVNIENGGPEYPSEMESDDEIQEIPTLDLAALKEQTQEHYDPKSSIEMGLEVQPTESGYSVKIKNQVINWYLQDEDGNLLKNQIPSSATKISRMKNIVSNKIGQQFPGTEKYIDYPTIGKNGEPTTKRMRREAVIESLTLLESLWETYGGDDYGTLLDQNGDLKKVFSPDIKYENDRETQIEYGELQPYNQEVSSVRRDIQDFFINSAKAADSYSIPFTVFDRTWGNTNLFGFRGKLTGSIGLWGDAEEGGSYSISANMDLSAYILGNRKNFMSGRASTLTNCEIPSNYSSFTGAYDIKKWGTSLNSSLPYNHSVIGTCGSSGLGTGGNSLQANNVNFDGFDACLQWTVFAGLKVRGCAGVSGSSNFNFTALGAGGLNLALIQSRQQLPYYGSASLALSPAGFDLAELSMNVEGKLLDLEHTFDSMIFSRLGAQASQQKADLIFQQKILGGRVYLKIRWWSVIKWGYKSWIKEIKPNGWVRNESSTADLLRPLR